MNSSRFNGVLRTTVGDTGQSETRRVLILSPYVQTSEQDIDYQNALVVDLQTQENEIVAQIEEMMKSEQAHSSKTFLEYTQFAQFKNGENVMKWLHDHNAIQKVSVDSVDIVMNGQHMNLRQINQEIARQNGHSMETSQQSATSIASEFSDTSMTADNTHPALIEGGQRNEPQQSTAPLNESVSVADSNEAEALQAVQQEAATIPSVNDVGVSSSEMVSGSSSEGSAPEFSKAMEQIEQINTRLEDIEKKLKNSKDKETVMIRMAKRYDMTESEIVKALESAGERKRKREQKKADKDQQES